MKKLLFLILLAFTVISCSTYFAAATEIQVSARKCRHVEQNQ